MNESPLTGDREIDQCIHEVISAAERLLGVYLERWNGRVPEELRGFQARIDTATQISRVAALALATHVASREDLGRALTAVGNAAFRSVVGATPAPGAATLDDAQELREAAEGYFGGDFRAELAAQWSDTGAAAEAARQADEAAGED